MILNMVKIWWRGSCDRLSYRGCSGGMSIFGSCDRLSNRGCSGGLSIFGGGRGYCGSGDGDC